MERSRTRIWDYHGGAVPGRCITNDAVPDRIRTKRQQHEEEAFLHPNEHHRRWAAPKKEEPQDEAPDAAVPSSMRKLSLAARCLNSIWLEYFNDCIKLRRTYWNSEKRRARWGVNRAHCWHHLLRRRVRCLRPKVSQPERAPKKKSIRWKVQRNKQRFAMSYLHLHS